jgi:hypothetical protein
MDKLTKHISEAVKKDITEWKEVTLEAVKKRSYDSCLCWSVRSTNKDQPIEKMLVKFAEIGPVSAEIIPAIPIIKSDDDTLTWLISAVELWGWDVDDADVILTPAGRSHISSDQKRFLIKDFLRLWPSLKPQVEAACEVSLIFRNELCHYLSAQVSIEDCAK